MKDKDPRILVIARRDCHQEWYDALTDDVAYCVVPQTQLYGRRFDLIIVDLPKRDLNSRFDEWWEQAVRCRLGPKGKVLYK